MKRQKAATGRARPAKRSCIDGPCEPDSTSRIFRKTAPYSRTIAIKVGSVMTLVGENPAEGRVFSALTKISTGMKAAGNRRTASTMPGMPAALAKIQNGSMWADAPITSTIAPAIAAEVQSTKFLQLSIGLACFGCRGVIEVVVF